MTLRVMHVVGARPNFMKIAPIMRVMSRQAGEFEQILIHTGQHYDPQMSKIFFEDLELPKPDINLEVGSGTHAWQTAQIMQRFEPVFLEIQPDILVVVGDVNSTLACSLVAVKCQGKVAHIEAGLRSFDRRMPEEINRVLTDRLSDLLFTSSAEANINLTNEGIPKEKIFFVGNVMIDTLQRLLPRAEACFPQLRKRFALDHYILVTLHRPSNVDDRETLLEIMSALEEMSLDISVVFPVHPRTLQHLHEAGWRSQSKGLLLLEPLGYLDFIALEAHANLILTDSGGVQEESTYLGIPCLTVRPNTERPVTILMGTNELVESNRDKLVESMRRRLAGKQKSFQLPPLWDGSAAERIVDVIRKWSLNYQVGAQEPQ